MSWREGVRRSRDDVFIRDTQGQNTKQREVITQEVVVTMLLFTYVD